MDTQIFVQEKNLVLEYHLPFVKYGESNNYIMPCHSLFETMPGIPASMSNNLVYIWSDSKIITPENCRSVMRRRANVCGEYCQQQSLFLLHNPLTHNLASHMRSPPVLRRPISWEVEYSQLNYWLEYPPHTCGNVPNRIKCVLLHSIFTLE